MHLAHVYSASLFCEVKRGLRCVSVGHHVEVVKFEVASEVAPHLAGRFPGENQADGGVLKVVRDPTKG